MDLNATEVNDSPHALPSLELAELDRYLPELPEGAQLSRDAQAEHLEHLRGSLETLVEESRPERATREPHQAPETRQREQRWERRMAAQIDITRGTIKHAEALTGHHQLAAQVVRNMAADPAWREAVTTQSRVPVRARELVHADPALARAETALAEQRARASEAAKRWEEFAARPGWERALRSALLGEETRLQSEHIVHRLAARSAEEARNQLRAHLSEQKQAEAARINRALVAAKTATADQFLRSERFVQRAGALLVAARETAHTGRPTFPLQEASGSLTYCGVREHAGLPVAAFRDDRGTLYVEHAALCRDAIAAAKLTPGDRALVSQHTDSRVAVTAERRGPNLSLLRDDGAGLIAAVREHHGKVDFVELVLDSGARARVVPCATDDLARELSRSASTLQPGGRLDLATGQATEPLRRPARGRA